MSEPLALVTGPSPMGEGRNPRIALAGRRLLLGRWRLLQAVAAGLGMAIFVGGCFVLGEYDAPTSSIVWLGVGTVVFILAGAVIAQRVQVRVVQARWRARGLPATHALHFAVEPDALVIGGEAARSHILWPYVSQVAPVSTTYWIILAAGQFYFLPRRLFAEPQAECAFLAAMLARMTPEARARSPEVRKLTMFT